MTTAAGEVDTETGMIDTTTGTGAMTDMMTGEEGMIGITMTAAVSTCTTVPPVIHVRYIIFAASTMCLKPAL